jgi:hypothetical protein
VSDWLDAFQMMGVGLNEGEKSLMRFAMKKEQERIIKLLEGLGFRWDGNHQTLLIGKEELIELIKGEK